MLSEAINTTSLGSSAICTGDRCHPGVSAHDHPTTRPDRVNGPAPAADVQRSHYTAVLACDGTRYLQKMLSWRTLVFCFYEEERAPPKARGKAESRAGRRQTTLVAYS
ncbi:MAG TPA: hypothetical protein PLI05_07770 [Methanotrichaceae archaeon]|nr:hypothetical protein [Methanotrichaceae archaeon]HQI91514.1 hypothetical protein [Methanotrichaceae archaeon]HQJ28852.1 hypothetical protein [Methanotrichaceae archaeon]